MNGRYLLDTNIVVALFANEDAIRNQLDQSSELFVPAIVLGELYFGAQKSARIAANVTRIDELAANVPILACDASTASEYGIIKEQLRSIGKPIPENDIWIAGIGRQYALTVVTRDHHFQHVEGLS